MNNNQDIWNELEEQARFKSNNLQRHYIKHPLNKEGGDGDMLFPIDMTPEEYNDAAHILSSSQGYPLGSSRDLVTGYINQDGRKVKIRHNEGSFNDFVVYVGDDVTGDVITYYIKQYEAIISQANPFTAGNIGSKYKCDLDGGFVGMQVFEPRRSMSTEEIEDITYKIEHNIPLEEL